VVDPTGADVRTDLVTHYAVIVHSKEARSGDKNGTVMTKDGDRFWACIEPEGWVDADGRQVVGETPPADVKVFNSPREAEKFAKRWKGHPWWVRPNGTFEVVPLVPNMVVVQQGWKRTWQT